jgi:hypothetical protein
MYGYNTPKIKKLHLQTCSFTSKNMIGKEKVWMVFKAPFIFRSNVDV